jgi:hypothetical protein
LKAIVESAMILRGGMAATRVVDKMDVPSMNRAVTDINAKT